MPAHKTWGPSSEGKLTNVPNLRIISNTKMGRAGPVEPSLSHAPKDATILANCGQRSQGTEKQTESLRQERCLLSDRDVFAPMQPADPCALPLLCLSSHCHPTSGVSVERPLQPPHVDAPAVGLMTKFFFELRDVRQIFEPQNFVGPALRVHARHVPHPVEI